MQQNPILEGSDVAGDKSPPGIASISIEPNPNNANDRLEEGGQNRVMRISEDPVVDKALNFPDLHNADGSDLVREAELFGSFVNLTNSIIGSGTL